MDIIAKDDYKASVGNNDTKHRIPKNDCVSDFNHKLICKHDLIASNKHVKIIDKIPLCEECYKKIKQDYNEAVNDGFQYSFEVYLDSYIEKQVEIISKIKCSHSDANPDGSESILLDLRASLLEKTYTPMVHTVLKSLEYLVKQGADIEESDNVMTIKFPADRDFLLLDEVKAIRTKAQERNAIAIPNFKLHQIELRNKEAE